MWFTVQGTSSSRFKARVVHGSRLGVHVGLRARRLGTRGSWGSEFGGSGLVGFGIQGSSRSRFKARVVHGSRLGVHVGLRARHI